MDRRMQLDLREIIDEKLTELEQDKIRLEWLVYNSAKMERAFRGGWFVQRDDEPQPVDGYNDWRLAIDKAMIHG